MDSSEAKLLLKDKIRECKRERREEIAETVLVTASTLTLSEAGAYVLATNFGDMKIAKMLTYTLALLLSYTMLTLEEPINLTYSKKEYLQFLKKLVKEPGMIELFNEVAINNFDEELHKVYKLQKES